MAEPAAAVHDYLRRYGYLPPVQQAGDGATREALQRFQRFFRLEETGEADEPTREAMRRPRCGLPDHPTGGDVAFATMCAWDHTELSYALDVGTDDIAGGAEWDAIRRAFASWEALGVLTFREVGVEDGPDIRVGWRPAEDPDLSMVGGALAHADFPPGCGIITRTLPKPVHFDDSEHVWAVGAVADAFDVETVALHELGHIVGLGHSNVPAAVMLPTVSPDFTKRTLTRDDVDGFTALYGTVALQ
jgi:Matrixin/Putative peptidoglycan binding domain